MVYLLAAVIGSSAAGRKGKVYFNAEAGLQGVRRTVCTEGTAGFRRRGRTGRLRLGRSSATTSSRGATRAATRRIRSPGWRAVGASTVEDRHGHQRADADLPLSPVDRGAVLRDPGLPVPGPRDPGHRHRRVAERSAGDRPALARVQGTLRPHARVGRADAQAVDRGARLLRGRVLQDARRHDLRPAGQAGADLHRRRRPAGREVCRPRGRRLHLHQRQGHRALSRQADPVGQGRHGRGQASPTARSTT